MCISPSPLREPSRRAPREGLHALLQPLARKAGLTGCQAFTAFAWQRGYGLFSIGKSQLPALTRYIDDQEEHHRTRTFQDEYRAMLKKYGIAYDEAHVWD